MRRRCWSRAASKVASLFLAAHLLTKPFRRVVEAARLIRPLRRAQGSLVAFGKLNGSMSTTPLNLPGKNYLNAGTLWAHPRGGELSGFSMECHTMGGVGRTCLVLGKYSSIV